MVSVRTLVIGARGVKDIAGDRNIGGELAARLGVPPWDLRAIVTSKKFYGGGFAAVEYDSSNPAEFEQMLEDARPQVVFIAIPTMDHGEAARDYALASLAGGAHVVTAEKGIASWQFDSITNHLDRIDLGAAVGGGNRFLYHPKLQHLRGRKVTLYGIFNATCNFACWAVGEGAPEDSVVEQAQHRYIAEPAKPGSVMTFKDLINGELSDIRMKVAAFYNKLVAAEGRYLLPNAFGDKLLNDEQANRLVSPWDKRRLLVTMTNQRNHTNNNQGVIGHMQTEHDGWYISIGFVSLNKSPVADWIESVKDIDNGFLLHVDGRRFVDYGPGAGKVTVDAMLEGAYRLLGASPRRRSQADPYSQEIAGPLAGNS